MEFVGLANFQLALTDLCLWKSIFKTVWPPPLASIPQHLIAISICWLSDADLINPAQPILGIILFIDHRDNCMEP